MKKFIFAALACAAILTSCKKEDTSFTCVNDQTGGKLTSNWSNGGGASNRSLIVDTAQRALYQVSCEGMFPCRPSDRQEQPLPAGLYAANSPYLIRQPEYLGAYLIKADTSDLSTVKTVLEVSLYENQLGFTLKSVERTSSGWNIGGQSYQYFGGQQKGLQTSSGEIYRVGDFGRRTGNTTFWWLVPL